MAGTEDMCSIDDDQLVHHISNFPILYDPKNKLYKVHTKKEMIWMDIAKSFNTTVATCKKRWKNIRDNYYKMIKNTKQTTGSASSRNRKRNPIFDQLGFLQNVEHERRVLTNTHTELAQITESTEPSEFQDQLDDTARNKSMETSDIQNFTPDEPDAAFSKTINKEQSANNELEDPPGKRKKNLSSQILTAIQKGYLERQVLMSQLTAVPPSAPEDVIDTFFKSLAMTVKTFPPLLRAQTKSRIFQVISDAELQLLQPEQPSSRLSTYSYESNSTSLPLQSPTDTEMPGRYDIPQGSSNAAQCFKNFQDNNEYY